ncbi:enoyl-CoA hydratase [Cupriavidus basilensis OR16]|uniref:Enoyl-CoA hydratase n=1 Tax=Cupriavidus basilensis OR16 TaxID=1127483 RepID=H1SAY4_9BURK|nr:enoyl-CoA hydratase/isomerase family protein [Cupriavidus basilensis]EHP40316.1 enoyl-CoA hydratase [Cupriavidus basilensis OR16]
MIANTANPATPVLLACHDGWAELILNRPERRNAIDGPLAAALAEILACLRQDDTIRAVVLRGAQGAFCSGLDLKAMTTEPPPAWTAGFGALWDQVHAALLDSRKAWVVALERYAINGGAALALAGDFLVCGETAFLQIGEVQIGMAAPRNAAWLALRHSEAVAARLCLLGDRVAAAELHRLGVATEVVADDQVLPRARAIASTIAAYPADAVAAIKAGMRAATAQMPAREWLAACTRALPAAPR